MSSAPFKTADVRSGIFHALQLVELFSLYALLPGLVYFRVISPAYRMPVLLLAAAGVVGLCWLFKVRLGSLGVPRPLHRGLVPTLVLGVFYLAIPFAVLAAWQLSTGRSVFNPPPVSVRLLLIALIYPFSALAQEFLYRAFFFYRYADALPRPTLLVLNAALFGLVHLIYGHWLSVVLATIGGVILAHLYARFGSLLGVALVHLLAGFGVFAMGYLDLFYIAR